MYSNHQLFKVVLKFYSPQVAYYRKNIVEENELNSDNFR